MAKYVFVTGGVVSSLGKGITAACVGRLLKARGLSVAHPEARPVHQRRPGHDEPVPARRGVRHRRRRRDRPGPRPLRALHRREPDPAAPTSRPAASTPRSSPRSAAATTSAARSRSSRTSPTRSRSGSRASRATGDPDVVIIEVGGTVGDIESLPFLEAIRQMRKDVGRAQRPVHPRDAGAGHRRRPASSRPSPPSTRSRSCAASASSRTCIVAALGQRRAGRDPREDRPVLRRGRRRRSSRRPTADTIYEVPLQFEASGFGRPGGARAGPGRSRRRAGPRRLAGAGRSASRRPSRRSRSRSSASTSSCRTPTCR